MFTSVVTLLGGIGLFLYGMQTMTGALKGLGGRRARDFLAAFTRSPTTGVITGAATTAVIQSSSATTLMAIGFVGAGLLSFPHAVGIIFGANIGTTFTGWLVILLGIKLEIGIVAMPLLFVAALVMILTDGRWARIGAAAAGFSLLFLGIDLMQEAMAGWQGALTPQDFPPDTLSGRLRLLLLGVAVTVVTQSSSAGVAMALVLIGAEAITFTQAAAMVIGMDIGTTFKALLASFFGSRAMRQTGLAHVVYNLITGSLAFATLGVLGPFVFTHVAGGDAQIGLVAFHSIFNIIGAAVMVPFAGRFAALIEWLLPREEDSLSAPLDPGLLGDDETALAAARAAADRIADAQFTAIADALQPGGVPQRLSAAQERVAPALTQLEDYLARISVPPDRTGAVARHAALLHQADHMRRLNHRMTQHMRVGALLEDSALARPARALAALLRREARGRSRPAARNRRLLALLERRMERLRDERLRDGPAEMEDIDQIFARTDGMRWLIRTAQHALRILHYSGAGRQAEGEAGATERSAARH